MLYLHTIEKMNVPCARLAHTGGIAIVIAFRKNNSRKRDSKKVKRYETNHNCEESTVPPKRIRLTEAQSLNITSYVIQGGRVRDINPLKKTTNHHSIAAHMRSPHPNENLSDNKFFDAKSYNDYACLVLQCINTFMGGNGQIYMPKDQVC